MARLSFAVMLLLGLVVVTGVRAQDAPELEERVSALETRVAALEGTPPLSGTRTPAEAMTAVSQTATARAESTPADTSSVGLLSADSTPVGDELTISGTGSEILGPFTLEEGLYVMTLELDAPTTRFTTADFRNHENIVFGPSVSPGEQAGTELVRVYAWEPGAYLLDVKSGTGWTLTIERP